MTTMYNATTAIQTAEGSELTAAFVLDMMGNDWSLLSQSYDLFLQQTTLASSVGSWSTRYEVYTEIPTFSVDATFDELELVVFVRVEAYVTTGSAEWRLTNDGATIVSSAITISNTGGYANTGYATLVYPTASVPTGRTNIQIQAQWPSDPGGATLFMRRAIRVADCEIYMRIAP